MQYLFCCSKLQQLAFFKPKAPNSLKRESDSGCRQIGLHLYERESAQNCEFDFIIQMVPRAQLYNNMKTDRSLRNLAKKHNQKDSNSPTQSSSYSEKKLWAKNYKNEPFPKDPKKILVARKFKLSDFSDEQQDNSGVVMEEEEIEVFEKKKLLPHFTVMSDRGEFTAGRSRIKSQRKGKGNRASSLCHSVENLKLPQVEEERKEEENDNQKPERSKLSQFKDKNEFNQSSSADHSRESLQATAFSSTMPERIIENEAEQKKSDKVRRDRTMVSSEMQKLIVDEVQVDDRKRKKEDSQQQIQEIIEEEKQEQEPDNLNKLRISLGKIEHETELLCKFKEEELRVGSNRSDSQSGDEKKKRRTHAHCVISENVHHQ